MSLYGLDVTYIQVKCLTSLNSACYTSALHDVKTLKLRTNFVLKTLITPGNPVKFNEFNRI